MGGSTISIVTNEQVDKAPDDRVLVWFDIDNTLYSASAKIEQEMRTRIHAYVVNLGFSDEEASELTARYSRQYGLTLRGLIRHHAVDPSDFDRKVYGTLPLEEKIKFDPSVRKLLEEIDTSKARVWALTNAFLPRAERVLRILKLDDLVEGVVACDYRVEDFACKPEAEYFKMAMSQAGLSDLSKCYFVDDNLGHVDAARALGWAKCVHFCERRGLVEGKKIKQVHSERENGVVEIVTLEQLRDVWPEIFVKCL